MQYRPKKRFGQNFLRDSAVVAKILGAARIEAGDRILEIGPGLGALTDQLLAAAGEVTVMEVDRDLVASLAARREPGLRIIEGDCLDLDWAAALPLPPYKLVANLPYNISSQVLFKVLDHRVRFSRLVLMFQKEVGDRLCAAPGSSAYGILSVFCQLEFDIRRVTVVPPGAFFPAPKVHSVVLEFVPLPTPRVVIADQRLFRRVVKGAFGQRRKTLRNSLLGAGFLPGEIDRAIEQCAIAPQRRGETLSLEEFARLSAAIAATAEN
ncbi:16S rRNA (adenine(1518)-N(6)/adenine(1519)-N(6)) -dimethyltransferase RsmA [Desulfuromonas carbonis]|uniref:16S rRNA (adenine(1518)-N(6)/adenine(1519)-N(6))- dimethyltransferase RsmA n=1 Tax=Desulfuromonas sp. DDH964 TaxID=1823759 RepID=UPI00078CA658|nr:16S rRNA (adenine(1518)-N(6)/adenine(1519)-N(6))-dimethyltransferase RsmA [Desulfuromonas sp. DDH964]AMV72396.1 KsgA/Dim1 family 16S ribosomal RNA methyltransferase [Desulfuromonas sp. DDH964]